MLQEFRSRHLLLELSMRVCVYAASSDYSPPEYMTQARQLGTLLAKAGCELVYGGGSRGSMGAVADGALEAGGKVIGILPRFMADLEWGHPGLTRLELVEDMRERKHRLLTGSDAVVALPGGCKMVQLRPPSVERSIVRRSSPEAVRIHAWRDRNAEEPSPNCRVMYQPSVRFWPSHTWK